MTTQPTPLTPRALKQGDTIGLISPSARLTDVLTDRHARSIRALERLGFAIKEIFTPIPPRTGRNATIAHKIAEIHSAFSDPAIAAVVCTCGGSHANELLRGLDYALIRANPKIFVGYSDITNLHCALWTHAGLRSFYGPTPLVEFGEEEPWELTLNHFRDVLLGGFAASACMPRSETCFPFLPSLFLKEIGEEVEEELTSRPAPGWRWIREGRCTGRVLGGCLEPLTQLAGTKFWPQLEGCIFLIETAMGEDVGSTVDLGVLRTSLTVLAMHGLFEKCVGIVVGRPLLPRDEIRAVSYQREYWKVFTEVLEAEEFDGPVLVDVDVGHTDPILTVPLGALSEMDSHDNVWRVVEDVVTL